MVLPQYLEERLKANALNCSIKLLKEKFDAVNMQYGEITEETDREPLIEQFIQILRTQLENGDVEYVEDFPDVVILTDAKLKMPTEEERWESYEKEFRVRFPEYKDKPLPEKFRKSFFEKSDVPEITEDIKRKVLD